MADPATSAIRMIIELFRSLSGGPIESLAIALQHSEHVFVEGWRRGGARNPSYNSFHPNHPHIGSRIARMCAEWPTYRMPYGLLLGELKRRRIPLNQSAPACGGCATLNYLCPFCRRSSWESSRA